MELQRSTDLLSYGSCPENVYGKWVDIYGEEEVTEYLKQDKLVK